MNLVSYLQLNPTVFIVFCTLIGLAVGSFLNVVVYRLPVMLERDWKSQCRELLELADEKVEEPHFNLSKPASHCPQCGHRIKISENIPVISFLLLRGRCAACHQPISIRYPIVEAFSGLLSLIVAWHFGVSWETLGALLITWVLIALSLIDFDHQLLPDAIVLPTLWLGLLLSLFGIFTDSQASIIGAVAGYLSLWSVFHIFKLLTGKQGMGHGDFKLLALFGAWLGWHSLFQIVLLSSLVGAIVGLSLILFMGRDKSIPIPFGPYLATAGWISLLWGEQINQFYFNWAGI
jgi:leader peptidase (prepilin peptidase)/N-methyltransferase